MNVLLYAGPYLYYSPMQPNATLGDMLRRFRNGALSLEETAREIEGLRIGQVEGLACIDLGRSARCGMPEVVLAEGKDPGQLAGIMLRQVEEAGRCIATRVTLDQAAELTGLAKKKGIAAEYREAGRVMIFSKEKTPSRTGGIVGIITAGTSDIHVAEEARAVAEEMGCEVRTAYDVGAAGIHRLFPALKSLLDAQVFIVAAGREGTLPAIVAGLVDRPVIGVPVSTGYGYMGQGCAALASMLQSCSVVAVVNIDAGFTAGAFAARIANMVAAQSAGERA
jgi:NCAIR mutase (PurE)-related protein